MSEKQSEKGFHVWLLKLIAGRLILVGVCALFGGIASAQTPPQPAACNKIVIADVVAAIGTLIVEPIGTTQTLVGNSNATADVRNNNVDTVLFREFVLNYQDDVTMQNNAGKAMKNNAAGEDTEDSGMKGVQLQDGADLGASWFTAGDGPSGWAIRSTPTCSAPGFQTPVVSPSLVIRARRSLRRRPE